MQRFLYISNSDRVALAAVADYMCNFLVKSHTHLCSILYGIYNSYDLMKDSCGMSIGAVTVKDDTIKSRAASPILNWKITWQHHVNLSKDLSVRNTTEHDGAPEQQRNPQRLAPTEV